MKVTLQNTIDWAKTFQSNHPVVDSAKEPSLSIAQDVVNLIIGQEWSCYHFKSEK